MAGTKSKTIIVVAAIAMLAVGFKKVILKNDRSDLRQFGPDEIAIAKLPIFGIGAVLRKEEPTGGIKIDHILPDSPADRAKLSAGQLIKKIDANDVAGKSLAECVRLVRGPIGTKVILEVVDPIDNTTNSVEMIRDKIPTEQPNALKNSL